MRKSKSKLDLNIPREVTQRILSTLPTLLKGLLSTPEDLELQDYHDSHDFAVHYQLQSFTSKYVDENTDSAELKRTRAIVKWLAVEDRNARTNSRLYNTDPSFTLDGAKGGRVHGWRILLKAGSIIRKTIGNVPPDLLLSEGTFSGGASTSRKRGPACLVSKFVGSVDVTPGARSHFLEAVSNLGTWSTYNPEVLNPRVVEGNILFTVPKTAIIDRVACKEPDGNMFCQKAVGDFIRRRLKRRAGIDLNDQSVNRKLARQGSIDGGLATIDLSSASDSMTCALVNILLPTGWYQLLDALRSPVTIIDGAPHVNEMFSSMGNGFTFELESLLFWAIARAVAYFGGSRGTISVYGDDIIVPSRIAPTLIQVLSWCGFKSNVEKTFFSGPFRESCGGHYHRGLDVTPFYLRRPIKDVSDLILFLNQLRQWIIQLDVDTLRGGWTKPNAVTAFWLSLASLVPKPLWGGYDLASRTQLVSKGPQKCKLLEITRSSLSLERKFQVGLYLSRLCVLDKRDHIPHGLSSLEYGAASFSGLPTNSGRFVMVRCKVEPAVFGVVRPLFSFEQL